MIILNSATIWAPTLWHTPWLRWQTNTTSSLKEWRKLTLQAGGLSLHLYLTSTSKSHEMTAKMRQKEQIHDETENRSGGVHWLPQAKPRSSCLNVDSQSSPDICDKPATHERRRGQKNRNNEGLEPEYMQLGSSSTHWKHPPRQTRYFWSK